MSFKMFFKLFLVWKSIKLIYFQVFFYGFNMLISRIYIYIYIYIYIELIFIKKILYITLPNTCLENTFSKVLHSFFFTSISLISNEEKTWRIFF